MGSVLLDYYLLDVIVVVDFIHGGDSLCDCSIRNSIAQNISQCQQLSIGHCGAVLVIVGCCLQGLDSEHMSVGFLCVAPLLVNEFLTGVKVLLVAHAGTFRHVKSEVQPRLLQLAAQLNLAQD